MSDQERCPMYPSILKSQCSHCQGTASATPGSPKFSEPKFSLKQVHFHGCPGVEILKDGGPVHGWDSQFQFGRRKAEMLIACIDLLRDFCKSDGDREGVFVPQVRENRGRGLRIRVYVEKRPDFERSDGVTVREPWLRLEALPPDDEHIGLGVMKCRAICEVEEDLRRWLRKHPRRSRTVLPLGPDGRPL